MSFDKDKYTEEEYHQWLRQVDERLPEPEESNENQFVVIKMED